MMEDELSLELANFESDFLFFQKELDNIRSKYLNKFVAIKNKQIIESASSIEELKDKLEAKNIDITKIVVEFVPEEETIMVL